MTDDTLHVRLLKPPRWQRMSAFGLGLVLMLLSAAVFALVILSVKQQSRIDALTAKLDQVSAQASRERDLILDELAEANIAIARRDQQVLAKDAEIRRLNALFLASGHDPGEPVPGSQPEPSPSVRASSSRPPAPVTPSPMPAPSPTATTSPTPRPCLVRHPITAECLLSRPMPSHGLLLP